MADKKKKNSKECGKGTVFYMGHCVTSNSVPKSMGGTGKETFTLKERGRRASVYDTHKKQQQLQYPIRNDPKYIKERDEYLSKIKKRSK